MRPPWKRLLLCAAILGLIAPDPARAVIIEFDYSRDTTGFFNPGPARSTLEAAGAFYSTHLDDTLEAIAPSGLNIWTADFDNPTTGLPDTVPNLNVPANKLIVFVGARDLPGSQSGEGGPGGYTISGTQAWIDTVTTRGEGDTIGPTASDFGPWGGAVTVDSLTSWHLDSNTSPTPGTTDLYAVLLHELGHLLGIGTTDSWDNQVSGTNFVGPASVAENGGPAPLTGDLAHLVQGTTSQVFPNGANQTTLMGPAFLMGGREFATDLDMAALTDIGWEVNPIPEPSTFVLAALALGGLSFYACRRKGR